MSRLLLHLLFSVAFFRAVQANMRFASPLQSLTIWDNGPPQTPRELYLEKFKAGLAAENKVRRDLKKKHEEFLSKQDTNSPDWAEKAVRFERARKGREDRMAEKAFDEAVKRVEAEQKSKAAVDVPNYNKYQFVGVINKDNAENPIKWYARAKPAKAKWSLRLVHVNKDAIIKDLFNQGKIDIFAKYKNAGYSKNVEGEEQEEETSPKSLQVRAEYEVRERSWRTLWNFSPKHFFTDSSGMYWRERRLRPGLYTDGASVYETSYRYKDGRNGIRRSRTLSQFMQDATIDNATKTRVMKLLKRSHPDIVIEG